MLIKKENYVNINNIDLCIFRFQLIGLYYVWKDTKKSSRALLGYRYGDIALFWFGDVADVDSLSFNDDFTFFGAYLKTLSL